MVELSTGSHVTKDIMIYPRNRDLEDEDNVLAPLPQPLRYFIEKLPTMQIDTDLVHDIKQEEFDKLTTTFEAAFAEMMGDNEKLKLEIQAKNELLCFMKQKKDEEVKQLKSEIKLSSRVCRCSVQ